MNIIISTLSWFHNLRMPELITKYTPTVDIGVKAIIVFCTTVLILKAIFTAILLPYTLRKSQKVMENVIANAQKDFEEMELLEPLNNNEKEE